MRLIDADKINFEEVFGGQSDFAKDLRRAAQELIGSQPTAFDKEKVIEDLQEAGQSCNEANDICGAEAIEYAIEIVEKGGIE